MSSAASAPPHTPPTAGSPATLAELLALPDEGHGYQLVDGNILSKEASPIHSNAQSGLSYALGGYGRRRVGGDRPGGWWILTEVLVDLGPGQVFRPDLAGWLRERLPELPREPAITVVPDWICEILSPSHAGHDLVKKKRVYWRHKVPHYWIIDPLGETLTVHRWTAEGYLEVLSAVRGERVRAEPFGLIELQVGALFGDEEDDPTV